MPKALKGWVLRRGCPPPQPTRKSVGVSWSPSAVSVAQPWPKTSFQHFLSVTERISWKEENAIFMLNVVTILTTGTAEICWNSVEVSEVSISGVDSVTPILNTTLVCCCWCNTVKTVFVDHMLVNKVNLVCCLVRHNIYIFSSSAVDRRWVHILCCQSVMTDV